VKNHVLFELVLLCRGTRRHHRFFSIFCITRGFASACLARSVDSAGAAARSSSAVQQVYQPAAAAAALERGSAATAVNACGSRILAPTTPSSRASAAVS
jgi:hypothetical protein